MPPEASLQETRDSLLRASIPIRPGEAGVTNTILMELTIDIVEGRLTPGQEMNSVALASRFGVSRTPVREALFRLEASGLVVMPARLRPYVWKPTWDQVKDSYELRSHLHVFVSKLVVERATEEELEELEGWQELREKDAAADDVDAYVWHNAAEQLVEAHIARNTELEAVIRSQGLRSLFLRHLSLSVPGRIAESARIRRELLNAYKARRPRDAMKLTEQVLMSGHRALLSSGLFSDGETHDQRTLLSEVDEESRLN